MLYGTQNLEQTGVDTSQSYDNRDWEAIRQWAKELAEMLATD